MSHLAYRNVLLGLLLVMPIQVFAQQYALLVGVSSYPNLDKSLQLNGPTNDVVLGKLLLKDAGFSDENIRVLATNSKTPNEEPTRQNILRELDSIANKAQRGDYVYLQFGGHGSQQPTRPDKVPKPADGMDEIFLPTDVGMWDGSVGSVKNAVRGDEFGQKIDTIRSKGAFVWAVFDACHSGGLTRGADPETKMRRAEPTALGIPQKLLDQVQADSVRTRGAPAPAEGALGPQAKAEGGYVFFYAAQTTEVTPESRFPQGDENRKPYGVFTYTLAQVIQSNPGITYRQAGERLLQIYAARNLHVTPLFEGSAIDAPIFGQKPGDTVRQWRVTKGADGLEIKAGSLQQFGVGAIFAVFQNAAAKSDAQPLGYLLANKVDVMRTLLSHTDYNEQKALTSIPDDAVVRLVNANVNLKLRVALPPSVPKGKGYALAKQVIDKLRNGVNEGLKVEWVAADKPADVRLNFGPPEKKTQTLADEQLWLVSADGDWVKQEGGGKTPSIRLDKSEEELSSVLAGELQMVAKALNLYRLAASSGAGLAGGNKLETHFYITHAQGGKREEMSGASVPELQKNDRLQITVHSNSLQDLDITVLGIDAQYGVSLLYPKTANEINRIHARDSLTIPADGQGEIELDGRTVGREAILVIAVEAEQNSSTVNLGFLEQPPLSGTRDFRIPNTVRDVFANAGFGGEETTRGFVNRGVAAEKTTMKIYQYKATGSTE